MAEVETVSYEYVKALPERPAASYDLIDVRDPHEIAATGTIPTSFNIPLGQLEENLKLSDEEFLEKYKRNKPANDLELVFYCKLGGRAAKAAQVSSDLGFVNAKSYPGSWTEWAQKEGL